MPVFTSVSFATLTFENYDFFIFSMLKNSSLNFCSCYNRGAELKFFFLSSNCQNLICFKYVSRFSTHSC